MAVTVGISIGVNWTIFFSLATHLWDFYFGRQLGFERCDNSIIYLSNYLTYGFGSGKLFCFGGHFSFQSILDFGHDLLHLDFCNGKLVLLHNITMMLIICCWLWRLPVRSVHIVLHFHCLTPSTLLVCLRIWILGNIYDQRVAMYSFHHGANLKRQRWVNVQTMTNDIHRFCFLEKRCFGVPFVNDIACACNRSRFGRGEDVVSITDKSDSYRLLVMQFEDVFEYQGKSFLRARLLFCRMGFPFFLVGRHLPSGSAS